MANTGMYARIDTINFDLPSFSKAMAEDCRKVIRLAAQKWMIAVLRRIPIRTGFLAGAFTPLENLVGVMNRNPRGIAKSNSPTSAINMSRNPLLSREKKLDHMYKRLRSLQESIEKSSERLHKIESASIEGLTEQKQQRSQQLKELHRTMRIEDQIKRVERQIQILLGKRARTPGGTGQLEVMRQLEKLRRKRLELGYFKNRGPYNPTLFRSSAKYKKVMKDIYSERQVITGKEYTNAERIAAMRKKITLEKQKIEIVRELIGKERSTVIKKYGKRVRAFGEYYYYPGGKVLKTPRSGVQFATPEKDIFGEFTESEHSQAREILSSFQKQIEATRAALSQTGFGFTEMLEKQKEETSLSEGTIDKLHKNAMQQLKDSKVYFTFKFEVAIIYWTVNDLSNQTIKGNRKGMGNNSTQKKYGIKRTQFKKGMSPLEIAKQQSIPWNSLMAGNAAFASYIRSAMSSSQFRSLNNIQDFMLRRTVNFDGSNAGASEVKRVMRS